MLFFRTSLQTVKEIMTGLACWASQAGSTMVKETGMNPAKGALEGEASWAVDSVVGGRIYPEQMGA